MPLPHPQRSPGKCPKGPTLRFLSLSRQYCRLHQDPEMPCIILYRRVTHTATALATRVIIIITLLPSSLIWKEHCN